MIARLREAVIESAPRSSFHCSVATTAWEEAAQFSQNSRRASQFLPTAAAFRDAPPLGMLGHRRRVCAARDWLRSTRAGGEGPLVEPASFVCVDRADDTKLLGAFVVTLMTGRQRSWYAGLRAALTPAPPTQEEGQPQAQLSWIFVDPAVSRRGAGSALLTAALRPLWALGHRELASATERGNDASMAWHWRNGFRLLPHFDSRLWRLREKRT